MEAIPVPPVSAPWSCRCHGPHLPIDQDERPQFGAADRPGHRGSDSRRGGRLRQPCNVEVRLPRTAWLLRTWIEVQSARRDAGASTRTEPRSGPHPGAGPDAGPGPGSCPGPGPGSCAGPCSGSRSGRCGSLARSGRADPASAGAAIAVGPGTGPGARRCRAAAPGSSSRKSGGAFTTRGSSHADARPGAAGRHRPARGGSSTDTDPATRSPATG